MDEATFHGGSAGWAVYGRGSVDMKGFVAAAMRAAVQATELERRHRYILLFL